MEQAQSDLLMRVPINDTIFNKIERLDLAGVLKVYGDFLHYLWDRLKPPLNWKGKIVNGKLTPPWLRGHVASLHGENCSNLIVCKYGELLRKG